jgi:hypothetical protein
MPRHQEKDCWTKRGVASFSVQVTFDVASVKESPTSDDVVATSDGHRTCSNTVNDRDTY